MTNGIANTAAGGAAVAGRTDTNKRSVPNDEIALSIRDVAQMFKVSPLTLRLYELRGLIRRERAGHTWVYSWSERKRIALIVKARQAGLRFRDLKPVIVAMSKQSRREAAVAGRLQSIFLISAAGEQTADYRQRAGRALSHRLGIVRPPGREGFRRHRCGYSRLKRTKPASPLAVEAQF